jgi:hypothetical protein
MHQQPRFFTIWAGKSFKELAMLIYQLKGSESRDRF